METTACRKLSMSTVRGSAGARQVRHGCDVEVWVSIARSADPRAKYGAVRDRPARRLAIIREPSSAAAIEKHGVISRIMEETQYEKDTSHLGDGRRRWRDRMSAPAQAAARTRIGVRLGAGRDGAGGSGRVPHYYGPGYGYGYGPAYYGRQAKRPISHHDWASGTSSAAAPGGCRPARRSDGTAARKPSATNLLGGLKLHR